MNKLTDKDKVLFNLDGKQKCRIPYIARFFGMTPGEIVNWIIECGFPISKYARKKYGSDSGYVSVVTKTSRHVTGYIQVVVNGKWHLEHRYVWEQANGPIPKGWIIHHINGIKDDNRLENLVALPRDNTKNRIKNETEINRIKQLESEVEDLKKAMETYERIFL